MTDEGATKTCVKCQIDVSTRKRHKDAKGRYWCDACYQDAVAKAKAKKQQAQGGSAGGGKAARDAGGDAGGNAGYGLAPSEEEVMSSLLAGSTAVEGDPCPQCHAPMPSDAVICTSCGFSREAGKQIRTHVKHAPKEKEPSKLGRRRKA